MSRRLDEPADNPLLVDTPMPAFDAIRAEHVQPAVDHVLRQERNTLQRLRRTAAPDADWLAALEGVHEAVHRVWGPIVHLNAVKSEPPLRAAFNECLPLVTEFMTELAQDRRLYERFQALDGQFGQERPTEAQIVRLGLRDFRLAGVALEDANRARYKALVQELTGLQARFEQNVMDASDAFVHHEKDAERLAGLPEIVLNRAAAAAAEKSLDGWALALDPPTYQAVMTHARSAALRKAFYEAWNTRASDQGPHAGRWDNGPLIEKILALRHEGARLLGFASFAEQSLATKMANSPEQVIGFLRDLGHRTRAMATAELSRLEELAGRELDPWDVAYFSEKLRERDLDISEEELRPYFPLETVLKGLFDLAEHLFGIRFVADSAISAWHEDVTYYRLTHLDGRLLGGLYTDLFARPNKRGGAWMDACVNRARIGRRQQSPVAHLVCNFTPPARGTPSLLTHTEVVTLFHEFGHSLHHLLTEVAYPSVAGINGVAWDAVELPSQFFENYAWLPEVLESLSSHYRTGAALAADKIDKLRRTRVFLAGLAMVRQLEFALFDFLLHHRSEAPSYDALIGILRDVREEVAVVFPPENHRFANGFSHVFGGGYAAGYYSYKWAELLAADAFSAFVETSPFDAATAARFRRSILAVGGSRDAIDAFREFRGRDPAIEPLLRQSGITAGEPCEPLVG
jgi:oligopeptidase A